MRITRAVNVKKIMTAGVFLILFLSSLMLLTSTVYGEAQVWPADENGNVAIAYIVQGYLVNEEAYVKGLGVPASTPVTIHIIPWDEEALPANAVASATTMTDAAGALPLTLVWSPPLTLGEYDIWVDLNQNDVLDADDYVGGHFHVVGFNVVPFYPYYLTTATGTGGAFLASDAGTITSFEAVDEATLPTEGKPVGFTFPHGLFSFIIEGLTPGQTLTVYLELPSAWPIESLPIESLYWKCQDGVWFSMPIGSDDGDSVITISGTDGGVGDGDNEANGIFVDSGGPALPSALAYMVTQVTDNEYDDRDVQIDGGRITWAGFDGNDEEIFMYDIASEATIQITDNNYDDMLPQIQGEWITWFGGPTMGETDVFLYNIVSGLTIPISTNPESDSFPQIDGGQITWMADVGQDFEIVLYDIASGITTPITSNTYDDKFPQIQGGQITWEARQMGPTETDSEIFLYDISSDQTVRITTNDYEDWSPRIYGGQVAWVGHPDEGGREVFLYDVVSGVTTPITDNTYYEDCLGIDEGKMVWQAEEVGDIEIVLYDIASGITTPITSNTYHDNVPDIDGGMIAWRGTPGFPPGPGLTEIFVYDIVSGETSSISTDTYNPMPKIQGEGGLVTWYGYDGNDNEIFVATPVSTLVVEGESPVNILVTAANGLQVGYDPATDSAVNEIEGATYSGPGTEPQVITILNPLQGVYIIDIFGTGMGPYTITIKFIAEDGSITDSETWTDTTSPGELHRTSVQLFEDGSLIGQPIGVIPEVPWGTIIASVTMIIALVAYVAMPKWRRKQRHTIP